MILKASEGRVFKTANFDKAARKAGIDDRMLAKAAVDLTDGKGAKLAGDVRKKRLRHNLYRAIVAAKTGRHWFFVYLYAKQDRDNISACELAGFQALAEDYEKVKVPQLLTLLANGKLMEILTHGDKETEV